eukprot:6205326-Pleurochrysis_carterae.AAC.2
MRSAMRSACCAPCSAPYGAIAATRVVCGVQARSAHCITHGCMGPGCMGSQISEISNCVNASHRLERAIGLLNQSFPGYIERRSTGVSIWHYPAASAAFSKLPQPTCGKWNFTVSFGTPNNVLPARFGQRGKDNGVGEV